MRCFICILIPLLFSLNLLAQNSGRKLNSLDVYVARLKVSKHLGAESCLCVTGGRKKKCHVYSMQIDSVYLIRDTLLYKFPNELKACNYLVVNKKEHELPVIGQDYVIGMYSSGNSNYLVLNSYFEKGDVFYIPWLSSYAKSEFNCVKYNLFQRLLFKIGFSPDKVFKRGVKITMNQDPIQKIISK